MKSRKNVEQQFMQKIHGQTIQMLIFANYIVLSDRKKELEEGLNWYG